MSKSALLIQLQHIVRSEERYILFSASKLPKLTKQSYENFQSEYKSSIWQEEK